MFDRRIGRIAGLLLGCALILAAVVLATKSHGSRREATYGASPTYGCGEYQDRARATERLLQDEKLDLGGM